MTFDDCHAALTAIRRRQGTRCPVLRIDYGGQTIRGRLARTDSDPENRHDDSSPYGILVLEQLGLGRGPETILQIANIPDDGLRSVEEGCASPLDAYSGAKTSSGRS